MRAQVGPSGPGASSDRSCGRGGPPVGPPGACAPGAEAIGGRRWEQHRLTPGAVSRAGEARRLQSRRPGLGTSRGLGSVGPVERPLWVR